MEEEIKNIVLSEFQKLKILSEIDFTTSRSSGPGGQNVNKVESKVTLKFDVKNTTAFNESDKLKILEKLSSKLTEEAILLINSQTTRSQQKNKDIAVEKLYLLLEKALTPIKPRKKTRPNKAAKEKRLKDKSIKSEIKAGRGKVVNEG